jgi:hypothetical protein
MHANTLDGSVSLDVEVRLELERWRWSPVFRTQSPSFANWPHEGLSRSRACIRDRLVVGLMALEALLELVRVLEVLFQAVRHRELRYFRRAGIAWTMTGPERGTLQSELALAMALAPPGGAPLADAACTQLARFVPGKKTRCVYPRVGGRNASSATLQAQMR